MKQDSCDLLTLSEAAAKDLYGAYGEWCEENRERPESQRRFGERLTERGFERYRGPGGAHSWRGIGLLSSDPCDPCDPRSGINQTDKNLSRVMPKQGSQGSQGSQPEDAKPSDLLTLAASAGWLAVSLGPGVTVGPGEAAWRTFAAKATKQKQEQAVAALRELSHNANYPDAPGAGVR
jgi:hypothetical protein